MFILCRIVYSEYETQTNRMGIFDIYFAAKFMNEVVRRITFISYRTRFACLPKYRKVFLSVSEVSHNHQVCFAPKSTFLNFYFQMEFIITLWAT